jgi:Fe-S-cluster containining protein
MGDAEELAAGDFSLWVDEMQSALRGERGAEVPCAGCTACCTSSQFIHIGPEETDTLENIPAELLVRAPGLPSGHVVLGYDQRGHCPMLIDNRCSIYDHRPKTCRTYDCRVYPAAGLEVDNEAKALIARRVERWRFSHPDQGDLAQHDAVRAAASFLRRHSDLLPDYWGPPSTADLAVLAIEIHSLFLRRDGKTGQATIVDPDLDTVRTEMMRRRGPTTPPNPAST